MLLRVLVPALALMLTVQAGLAASSPDPFESDTYETTKTKKKPVQTPTTTRKRTNFAPAIYNCSYWPSMTWSDYVRCGYDPPFWTFPGDD